MQVLFTIINEVVAFMVNLKISGKFKLKLANMYAYNVWFCFSELKRRLKAEQKAKEKAEKEQAKAENTKDETAQPDKKKDLNAEEDISPNVIVFTFITYQQLPTKKITFTVDIKDDKYKYIMFPNVKLVKLMGVFQRNLMIEFKYGNTK